MVTTFQKYGKYGGLYFSLIKCLYEILKKNAKTTNLFWITCWN